jgi:hypothetical protein
MNIRNSIDIRELDKCHVAIIFDYNRQYIEIEFDKILQSNNFITNREVFVETSIKTDSRQIFTNSIYIVNIVEFICDDEDECNYRFLLDHLQWLFNANYKTLVNVIRPLLIPRDENTSKVYHRIFRKQIRILVFCTNYKQNEEQLCSTGTCYLFHSISTNESEGGCLDNSFALTGLYLDSIINTNESIYQNSTRNYQIGEHTFQIVYRCHANNCNNRINAEFIKKTVKDHYNLSAMYEVLKVKIEEDSHSIENITSASVFTKNQCITILVISTILSSLH